MSCGSRSGRGHGPARPCARAFASCRWSGPSAHAARPDGVGAERPALRLPRLSAGSGSRAPHRPCASSRPNRAGAGRPRSSSRRPTAMPPCYHSLLQDCDRAPCSAWRPISRCPAKPVSTRSIGDWRRRDARHLAGQPTVFLLLAE
ncbi:MAG: hypothetical protein MZW92_49560 [Comamonadaceae bacterium]|nr:hypothetical protein [Comamonadaceae bacterium]